MKKQCKQNFQKFQLSLMFFRFAKCEAIWASAVCAVIIIKDTFQEKVKVCCFNQNHFQGDALCNNFTAELTLGLGKDTSVSPLYV